MTSHQHVTTVLLVVTVVDIVVRIGELDVLVVVDGEVERDVEALNKLVTHHNAGTGVDSVPVVVPIRPCGRCARHLG
eukprot:6474667-Amphidinium_carterae.2